MLINYHYGDEAGQRPPSETTSDGTDDNASDSERSDDLDNDGSNNNGNEGNGDDKGNSNDKGNSDGGGLHDPMDGWEEFDASAIYQKKLVDPEMRQWILTKDCRRIISDAFFDNPVQNQGMHIYCKRTEPTALHLEHALDLCCDNCIRKKDHTRCFESIYDLIGFLDTSCRRELISCPVDDDDSDLGLTTSAKTWGNLRAGNRLTIRRQVLEGWRDDCWKKNYRLCSWGPVGVMPDPVLSTLTLSIKIQTVDDLLEVVSDWGYARKYGDEVLLVLKEADHEHQHEAQAQRMKTREVNRKHKLEELQADEELKVLQGFMHTSSSNTPMALVHTRMINPIVVKHVKQPTQPQPPRPQPWPIPASRPYTCTDVFDVLLNNSRRM